jgi:hypothetical protein
MSNPKNDPETLKQATAMITDVKPTDGVVTPAAGTDAVLKEMNEIDQARFPCSRQEAWNLVTNKLMPLMRQLAETKKLAEQTASMIDIFFLYAAEEGLEVKDGRIKFTVEEVVGWATARAQQKAAEAAAAKATPTNGVGVPPEMPPMVN